MFWRRNGESKAAERLETLEIRLARLAEEVHEAQKKLDRWETREVAREAAFKDATDKLHRAGERARKYRERDRDADGDGDTGPDDDAFYELWRQRGGRVGP